MPEADLKDIKSQPHKELQVSGSVKLVGPDSIEALSTLETDADPVDERLQSILDNATVAHGGLGFTTGSSSSGSSSSSSTHPRRGSGSWLVPGSLDRWQQAANYSVAALKFLRTTQSRPMGDSWELAWVAYIQPGSASKRMVELANFGKKDKDGAPQTPSLSRAQLVRVDDMGRAIFSTLQFRPWCDFHAVDEQVLIPARRVHMLKEKPILRTPDPSPVLRAKSIWQHCRSAAGETSRSFACMLCNAAEPQPLRCCSVYCRVLSRMLSRRV